MKSNILKDRNAVAWLLLTLALALHIFDEAMTGFLQFYNPLVSDTGKLFGLLRLPMFTFGIWIGGLSVLILICLSMTLLVRRGGKIIRVICTAFGLLMIFNSLGHILGSIYYGRLLPGFMSSPILFLAALYVVYRGFRGNWTA
jgi:hypothetical protein